MLRSAQKRYGYFVHHISSTGSILKRVNAELTKLLVQLALAHGFPIMSTLMSFYPFRPSQWRKKKPSSKHLHKTHVVSCHSRQKRADDKKTSPNSASQLIRGTGSAPWSGSNGLPSILGREAHHAAHSDRRRRHGSIRRPSSSTCRRLGVLRSPEVPSLDGRRQSPGHRVVSAAAAPRLHGLDPALG